MCPYQQNKPAATDQLNDSQVDIQTNFLEIYNWVAVNHGQFDSAISGLHTQVTLPENVAPTPTAIDQANIYSQLSALTNQTELFWQRENNGTRLEWTACNPVGNPGWMKLPCGIIVKWGTANSTGTGFNVVFPVGPTIPVFTTAFFVIATTNEFASVATSTVPATLTTLQFTVNTYSVITGLSTAAQVVFFAMGT